MNATLIDCCDYHDGYIERTDGMTADIHTDAAELVESGLVGWGSANAVVRVDGGYYLARIEE
jgi:hypothetical protein